jgi:radical SAM protein with 4Fe4S-binding SPASM domain
MHEEFLKRRQKQETDHFDRNQEIEIFSSLVVIEVNLTELCNRKCVFCPRVDPKVYPNRNLHTDIKTSEKIANDLLERNYSGRISFSGFGEPLLCKDFDKHIEIFRKKLPNVSLETNTNGDKLNPERIIELFDIGLTNLYINMYDGPEQIEFFEKMILKTGLDKNKFYLRPHWVGYHKNWGLFLNNRSGLVTSEENEYLKPLEASKSRRCFYPFYKMFIDYNGDVLFCSNDWGRKIIVGNINDTSIYEIWTSEKLNKIRQKLSKKDRNFAPCNTCSINGELHGEKSFQIFEKLNILK